jgi:hypothetical protein
VLRAVRPVTVVIIQAVLSVLSMAFVIILVPPLSIQVA